MKSASIPEPSTWTPSATDTMALFYYDITFPGIADSKETTGKVVLYILKTDEPIKSVTVLPLSSRTSVSWTRVVLARQRDAEHIILSFVSLSHAWFLFLFLFLFPLQLYILGLYTSIYFYPCHQLPLSLCVLLIPWPSLESSA